jgi:hypothetical protein
VPGQFLERPQVDPAPATKGQVGVPQGVKISVERAIRPFDCIGNPSSLKVETKHLGTLLGPLVAPDRLPDTFTLKILPEQ